MLRGTFVTLLGLAATLGLSLARAQRMLADLQKAAVSEPAAVLPAAVLEVRRAANALVQQSGCPVRFVESEVSGSVTDSNRDAIVRRITETAATLVGVNFRCTAVMTLSEGQSTGALTLEDVARYRNILDSLVQPGQIIVRTSWLRTSDSRPLSTEAIVGTGDGGKVRLTYDPIISSWARPVTTRPRPKPPSPERGSVTWKWKPWAPNGTPVVDVLGGPYVRKNPLMIVTFDDNGHVKSEEGDPQVEALVFTAKGDKKADKITREEGDCVRWWFSVHWASPSATIKLGTPKVGSVEFAGIGWSGTDHELLELCWVSKDSLVQRILEGPGS